MPIASDPFEMLRGGGRFRMPNMNPAPTMPALAPEDEESLLSQIGGGALNGLGFIGGLIDKYTGSRALRGLLGGRPEELASIIPFSDALGITDESNAVSGAELLGNKDASFLSPAGLGGFGLEVLLSPGNFISAGSKAATKLGLAAQKVGALPKTAAARTAGLALGSPELQALGDALMPAGAMGPPNLAAIANKPLGGAVGFHLPFGMSDTVPFASVGDIPGVGPALTGAGRAAGAGWDFVKGLPGVGGVAQGAEDLLGRAATGINTGVHRLFDKSAGDMPTALTQDFYRSNVHELLPNAIATGANRPASELAQELLKAGYMDRAGVIDPLKGNLLWDIAEGAVPAPPELQAWDALRRSQLADNLAGQQERAMAGALELTPQSILSGPGAGSQLEFAPRSEPRVGGGSGLEKARPIAPSAALGRKEALKGLTRNRVNDLFTEDMNGMWVPGNTSQMQSHIADKYLGMGQKEYSELYGLRQSKAQGQTLTPAQIDRLTDLEVRDIQAKDLSNWKVARGNDLSPIFTDNVMDAHYTKLLRDQQRFIKADAVHKAAVDFAVPMARVPGAAAPDGVPFVEFLEKVGLAPMSGGGGQGIERTLTGPPQLMAKTSAELAKRGFGPSDLANLYVPKDIAEPLIKMTSLAKAPEAFKEFLGAWDSVTNLTKSYQTFWPSTKARNLVSDVANKWIFNASDPTAPAGLGIVKPMKDFLELKKNGLLADANAIPAYAGMTADQASKQLLQDMVTWDPFRKQGRIAAEVAGAAGSERVANLIPGSFGPGLVDSVKGGLKEGSWNPLAVAGVGGRTEDAAKLVKAGRNVDNLIGEVTNGSSFIAYMRQGFTPEQAAKKVFEAHYDFGNLSRFERDTMKRVVPFYCVPDSSQILTRDGWKSCDELVIGEEVMTYNTESDSLEWQKCQNKAIFDHDQELMVFDSTTKKFAFTPDHRWPVRRRGESVMRGYGLWEYPERIKVVRGHELRGQHSFIQAAKFHGTESIVTPEDARLIGWLVTDGYYRKTKGKNHTEALIYQNPKKFLTEVIRVAGSKPRKPHPQTGVVAVNVELVRKERVLPYLDKSKLPQLVTRLSKEAAEAMYEAMYMAEGTTKNPKRAGHKFVNFHPGVMEAFRILALMLGKTSRMGKNGQYCYIKSRECFRFLKVQSGELKMEHFKGRVWCPQTPNGTWVMKQNGCILITGNSWLRQSIPSTVKEVLTEPGGKMAHSIRAAGTAKGSEPGYVPDYLGDGIAMPIGEKDEKGNQRFVSRLGLGFEDIGELTQIKGWLGALNPLLKAPLEMATGRQLFSGRALEDLDSMSERYLGTRMPIAENILMNSPASRFLTMARQTLDPRKDALARAINFGTGVKLTDVDTNKAKDVAVRKYAEDLLRGTNGVGMYSRLFVNRDQVANLSPEERALYQLYLSRAKAKDGKGASGR